MEEINSDNLKIDRSELVTLHNHYESTVKDELEFFFKYLNFYIGLFSALLAGTITGLLSFKDLNHPCLKYILLLGPLLIIVTGFLGYRNLKVYYRRFLEALLTTFNIKSMLGYDKVNFLEGDICAPLFRGENGKGFIVQFKRHPIKKIIAKAKREDWDIERILNALLKEGDTLRYVKFILLFYKLAAVALILFICLYR